MRFGLAVIFAAGGCAAGSDAMGDTARGSAPADSVVRAGVVYHGRLSVAPAGGRPTLTARVDVRGVRPGAEVEVESEAGDCNPPLYLRPAGGGREVAWSDVAWRARRARDRAEEVACMGTGLIVRLAPGETGTLAVRRYPVRAVRGDSLRAGWYAGSVAVVLVTFDAASGVNRFDTLRVPAGRVRLP